MEARLSPEKELQFWEPVKEFRSIDNQAYFTEILPNLHTVEVYKVDGLPVVFSKNMHHELSTVYNKLSIQEKWIDSHDAQQAFSPAETDVGIDLKDEEVLVRSLHLSLIQGALDSAISGFSTFEVASQDIVYLLGSLNRPTHRYRFLSGTHLNFMSRYYRATKYSRIFNTRQLDHWRYVVAEAVCKATVDAPSVVKNIVEKEYPNNKLKEEDPIIKDTNEGFIKLVISPLIENKVAIFPIEHDSEIHEISLPKRPRLQAFLREFGYDKYNLPTTVADAINLADVHECNLQYNQLGKEHMSSLAIMAYVESLSIDEAELQIKGGIKNSLAYITKSEDGITARIVKLADHLSGIMRMTIKENNSGEPLPIKINQFPKLEILPESLPKAFSILRIIMTELGNNPVAESDTTKNLVKLVEDVLSKSYPSKRQHLTAYNTITTDRAYHL